MAHGPVRTFRAGRVRPPGRGFHVQRAGGRHQHGTADVQRSHVRRHLRTARGASRPRGGHSHPSSTGSRSTVRVRSVSDRRRRCLRRSSRAGPCCDRDRGDSGNDSGPSFPDHHVPEQRRPASPPGRLPLSHQDALRGPLSRCTRRSPRGYRFLVLLASHILLHSTNERRLPDSPYEHHGEEREHLPAGRPDAT